MHLCIFNPEHDLCLAKGRANYLPPRSAIEFAIRDAKIMATLYQGAECVSVYDERTKDLIKEATSITAWGWNNTLRYELLRRGAREEMLPNEETLRTIRRLQHRTTVLPLQKDCCAVRTEEEVEKILEERRDIVLKAPWSGAGRGLRWVHGSLTEIDRGWIKKVCREQGCAVVEPIRKVEADVALEYMDGTFTGYSFFRTGSGVYKENVLLTDREIEERFDVGETKRRVEEWLRERVWPEYSGPLGVDLMVSEGGREIHVAEMNVRHTMGMVAHAKIAQR